jgi:hypothetical protein
MMIKNKKAANPNQPPDYDEELDQLEEEEKDEDNINNDDVIQNLIS